jgi:hypothetical protein
VVVFRGMLWRSRLVVGEPRDPAAFVAPIFDGMEPVEASERIMTA